MPRTLTKTFVVGDNVYRVQWCVDGSKLKHNIKEAVSPAFELSSGRCRSIPFKLMCHFMKVRSPEPRRGTVALKCESELCKENQRPICFRISAKTPDGVVMGGKGHFSHNFAESSVATWSEEFNFTALLDKTVFHNGVFMISLDILPRPPKDT